jgi:hypothetical protein
MRITQSSNAMGPRPGLQAGWLRAVDRLLGAGRVGAGRATLEGAVMLDSVTDDRALTVPAGRG